MTMIMFLLFRNDEDAYAPDGAVPTKGVELSCLALGQSASSGPWLSPGPLELFDDDRESVCELLGDVAGNYITYMV